MAPLRTILKWLGICLGAVAGLALVAIATVYVLIGRDLGTTFEAGGTAVAVPTHAAAIAEGERLARLRGCFGGCHGKTVNGNVFLELPDGTKVIAPDLARIARDYTVAELENAIRDGIRPDGTSTIAIMPSAMLHALADADLGAIIAFLRSRQPGSKTLGRTTAGPLGRAMFFYYRHMLGTILAAETVDRDARRVDSVPDDPMAKGRYLAMTTCTECHGHVLRGGPGGMSPTLAIVVAYSPEDFERLMRTGEPIGNRKLGLMADVARSRFAYFRDDEIEALHGYLRTLAATAPQD